MATIIPYFPSSQVMYIGMSFTLFFGGAIYGAKNFLKGEELSTDLRQTLKSKPVSMLAVKALTYGTGLCLGSVGLSVLFYCAATGTHSPQQFGKNMKELLRFTEYPDGYTESKEKKLREIQEKESVEHWEGIIGPYFKESDGGGSTSDKGP